ncbi:hypothetical protein PQX77_000184 [Marasmius sp. AFHP31]|nr:hypothetical protein PQX77_000184 [Marasmius sp. AFHP31]
MSHARDLLSLILSSNSSSSAPTNLIPTQAQIEPPKASPNTLSATIVTKPPPITPLQAFNAQLAIGGKDEALRKAANLFKVAAERMEKGRLRSEHYWVDALKIRRANWSLVPAPLPFGAPTGKGADRTTKDFVISYGLEESPPNFRRRAVAQMSYTGHEKNALIFPHRQNARLRISVASTKADGSRVHASNTYTRQNNETDLNDVLRTTQLEVIEQEIYAQIAKEAGSLPTASARVSERLILIDAAQSTELKFEMVDAEEIENLTRDKDPLGQAKCDFIYHYLLALLLRRHTYQKRRRLGMNGSSQSVGGVDQHAPLVLQPVIDILQYQVFCRRIRSELDDVCSSLNKAGISTTLRFSAVEEIGKELVKFVSESNSRGIGGEATLRVDDRYTIRLTMTSPSSLTVHLSQANISILSIPELKKLLSDEVESLVLERICSLGRQICNDVGGIWFVDMNRCVGRWDGGAINFHVVKSESERYELTCVASRFGRRTGSKDATVDTYDNSSTISVMAWAQDVIRRSLIDG